MNTITKNDRLSIEIENLRIYIVLQGGFFYHDSCQSPTHSHNRYEFHLMIEGRSHLTANSNKIILNSSQACIIAPNIIHTWKSIEEKTIKTSFCFSFEKTNRKSNHDIYDIFTKAFSNIEDVKKIDFATKYVPELNRIMSVFYSHETFSQLRLQMYFSLLMLSLAEDLLPEKKHEFQQINTDIKNENTDKNIRRVMIEDYINLNYGKDINLDSLSNTLHLSKKQTERIFMQEIGISFKAFILKIRLEAAIYYLCNTQMSVAEISAKVGYKSYNGFYRLFLSQTGITPLEYRYKFAADKNSD